MRQALGFLLAACLLAAAPDARADAPAWLRAEWGMDAEALERALAEDGLTRLPVRLDYGELSAEHSMDVDLAGLRFRALFQIAGEDGLKQILFERRRPMARPADLDALVLALRETFGPEDRRCLQARKGGRPLRYELIWERPRGVLHAVFLDFSSTGLVSRRTAMMRRLFPSDDSPPKRDKFRPTSEDPGENGLNLSALPRRLLLRWHDPAAKALSSPECVAED